MKTETGSQAEAVQTDAEKDKEDKKETGAYVVLLLVLVPLLGIGGTAAVSLIRGFSLSVVILNVFVAAVICLICEVPVSGADIDSFEAPFLIVSYISGLIMSFASPFIFEFTLPFAAPAVIIGLILGRFAGLSALVVFTSISTILLYESGLYFFYIFVTGFILIILFCDRKKYKPISATVTFGSLSSVLYLSCIAISGVDISPGRIVFPLIGLFLNILIVLIVYPKIKENVVDRYENFLKSVLDPDHELIRRLKKTDSREYAISVHTSHLTDMLSEKISLNRDKTFGIAYYMRIGLLSSESGDIPGESLKLLQENDYPDFIMEGIREYYGIDGLRLSKESGCIYIVRDFVSELYSRFDADKERSPDYKKIVSDLIKRKLKDDRIKRSDLSLYDLAVIQEVLKDKVFYYDTILRK